MEIIIGPGLDAVGVSALTGELGAESFLDLLRKSDLVPDDQLPALVAELAEQGVGQGDVRPLAEELIRRNVLTTWQAEMLQQGKHEGFRLGPYRILRPLGRGGMGSVFLAEHEMMRRLSAVKLLPAKYQGDPELLKRFHLEARAIAALDHPHIVRAYDFNMDVRHGKKVHYLVMEYVEGQDLQQMVETQGPLDFRQAADYIRQAADGLFHAHQAGFVHRDIKPANLLAGVKGNLKVLDLGMARVGFEADALEGDHSVMGTADYIAPEQVVNSQMVDGRADIYSLGLAFYSLLTGRRPFSTISVPELLLAHVRRQPKPIARRRPDVPAELARIIERMTEKDPARRYLSAGEVAEALQRWLNQSSGGAEAEPANARAKPRISVQAPPVEPAQTTVVRMDESELDLAPLEDEPIPKRRSARRTADGDEPTPSGARRGGQPRAPKLPELCGWFEKLFTPESLAALPTEAPPPPPPKPATVYDRFAKAWSEQPRFRLAVAGGAAAALLLTAVLAILLMIL